MLSTAAEGIPAEVQLHAGILYELVAVEEKREAVYMNISGLRMRR